MERRVSFFLVGLFSLVIVAGITVFVLWANERHGHRNNQSHYRIYFDQGVNGLSVGSGIRYLGVEVGRVLDIDIDTAHEPLRVRVMVGVNQGIPISNGDIAMLKPSGITGVSFIDINHGTTAEPLTTDPDGMAVIPSQLSGFDQLLSSGNDSAKKLQEVLERVNQLLSDQNLTHLSGMFANIDRTTGTLAAHGQDIGTAIAQLSQAATSLNSLLETLRKQGVGRDAASTLRDSREAADNLSELSRTLRDNPSRLIFPSKSKGVEVPP